MRQVLDSLNAFVRWILQRLKFLSHTEMPVWLSLILIAGGAFGTYYLAPEFNRTLQQDNARATHISDTIKRFNDGVVELLKSVRVFNEALAHKRPLQKKRESILDRITELQWRLIDVEIIFSRTKSQRSEVANLKKALTALRLTVMLASDPKDQAAVLSASETMSVEAGRTVDRLYIEAGLKADQAAGGVAQRE